MNATSDPRRPRAFSPSEAEIIEPAAPQAETAGEGAPAQPTLPAGLQMPTFGDIGRGVRWGTWLLSAMGALASIAFGVWFSRFVSVAVAREDWIGWISFGLAIVILVTLLMLILRELIGFVRLRRLGKIKAAAEKALRERNVAEERETIQAIKRLLAGRAELRWHLARLDEHARDVRDPGDLMRLADRDLMLVLDGEARRLVAKAAKRVTVVTAISPAAFVSVGYVLIENLRLLRNLAGLYGGRPGFAGTARLARMVLTHIVATGSIALTDDLIGQFLGQDLLRRVSRRLGEGVFNGALTARIGAAAVEVTRPLPFIEAPPVRVRDFLGEIMRRAPGTEGATKPTT
ncbi:TIGR01620 family protein [Hyphomicrobium sp. CS1BSMeth3]|uniref:YcjF family protein n=1 Tax=Hyphomicrobium sp. CS1BSMeth3 TaxID=1892844 RepID=UPI000930689D|nr:TIGR01620 family protein [Hyphomicrobium sp. CS1BSMeth3]